VEDSGRSRLKVLSRRFLEGVRKTTKKFIQDSRCSSRDSNRVPSEHVTNVAALSFLLPAFTFRVLSYGACFVDSLDIKRIVVPRTKPHTIKAFSLVPQGVGWSDRHGSRLSPGKEPLVPICILDRGNLVGQKSVLDVVTMKRISSLEDETAYCHQVTILLTSVVSSLMFLILK
jgi:hypothetical protein